ncbi:DeoR/GlpR family DNA-binding transcription regulator [Aliiroseovarius sp. 2305UL8-7]|uniref:DeoR/GlpR family DNA-binding transcription regulator n=1 Tax=Aliiroseovarius conchicola TaxID=3121637 RepID=UPI0035283CDD
MRSGAKTKARQAEILRLLKKDGRALVDDLADMLGTTPQTVRKDLSALAEDNQIIRFHGGATLSAGTEYAGFDVRRAILRDEKAAIGRAVAAEIPNNSSIILNGGTTTAEVARHLVHHVGLKVVVDSVYLANILREYVGVEVMVPAGVVRGSDGAIFGEPAIEFIRNFRADISVVGAAAIEVTGALLDYDLHESGVSRAIIQSARNVILAADGSKFGRLAPVCFGHISQVGTLVTDASCPSALGTLCQDAGVRVVAAG